MQKYGFIERSSIPTSFCSLIALKTRSMFTCLWNSARMA